MFGVAQMTPSRCLSVPGYPQLSKPASSVSQLQFLKVFCTCPADCAALWNCSAICLKMSLSLPSTGAGMAWSCCAFQMLMLEETRAPSEQIFCLLCYRWQLGCTEYTCGARRLWYSLFLLRNHGLLYFKIKDSSDDTTTSFRSSNKYISGSLLFLSFCTLWCFFFVHWGFSAGPQTMSGCV